MFYDLILNIDLKFEYLKRQKKNGKTLGLRIPQERGQTVILKLSKKKRIWVDSNLSVPGRILTENYMSHPVEGSSDLL